MDATRIVEIENDGLNMASDGVFLYVRGGRVMYKYAMPGMTLCAENTVFRKDGKARTFALTNDYICLLDFCDLYILDKADLHVLDSARLGENLSSDLVAVCPTGRGRTSVCAEES